MVSYIVTYVLTLLLGLDGSQRLDVAMVGGLLGTLIDLDHFVAVAAYPGGLTELAEALGRWDVGGAYVILCGSDGVLRFPLYHIVHPIILGAGFALWIIFMPFPLKHCAFVLSIHFLSDFSRGPIEATLAYLGASLLFLGFSVIWRILF